LHLKSDVPFLIKMTVISQAHAAVGLPHAAILPPGISEYDRGFIEGYRAGYDDAGRRIPPQFGGDYTRKYNKYENKIKNL
jgi:hypothetical protein